jgi:cell wall-associated NlpC family hydrolase
MVSQVLVGAGFDRHIIDSNVDNLESKLQTHGFVSVPEADMKPGDVIIATGPGPRDGHTGIYTGNGQVFSNSSSRGVFATSSYDGTFGGFSRRAIYRYSDHRYVS